MLGLSAFVLAALASFVNGEVTSRSPLSIEPVPALNATKYLGLWYQMYSSLGVNATFEKGSVCVAATYGLNPNGTVSVQNQARLGSPSGPWSNISGWAAAENATQPAALTVHLNGVPVPAPYWIVLLGEPETPDGQYPYAVVSDPFEISLFVLTRNIDVWRRKYEADVLQKLDKLGFHEFWNTPLPTRQAGCW